MFTCGQYLHRAKRRLPWSGNFLLLFSIEVDFLNFLPFFCFVFFVLLCFALFCLLSTHYKGSNALIAERRAKSGNTLELAKEPFMGSHSQASLLPLPGQ